MSFDVTATALNDPRTIKIPVFEGPMELLLHLIKQNKIDIYDIPISLITSQYLQYIELMKELNFEIASEFIVMAATLIYIKSQMLLPPEEDVQTQQQEDPRAGLVQKLLEYQAYKEASNTLKQREDIWLNVFNRNPIDPKNLHQEIEPTLFDINMYDLLSALQKILSKAPPESIKITRETLTVQDRMVMILQMLETSQTIKFDAIFASDSTKLQIIITFLALLEVLRIGAAKVYQNEDFSDIWIIRPTQENSQ